jgi:chromate transporter
VGNDPDPSLASDASGCERRERNANKNDAEQGAAAMNRNAPEHPVSFREAFWTWVHVGLNSFGGPAGQIAVMHRVLVEQKRWISETRFLHALNYCMLLPGPEATQLAIYVGWLLHRVPGGVTAGVLFVLPGVVALLALSLAYAAFGQVAAVQALFFGLKPAVLAVVVEAVLRIGRRALKNEVMWGLAAAAFVAIFFFDVPFPLIVLGAGLTGLIGGRLRPDKFLPKATASGHDEAKEPVIDALLRAGLLEHTRPSLARSLRVLLVCLALWLGPLLLVAAAFGAKSVYVQEGVFFSKAAVVTFGGAYAVLAYAAQAAVKTYGWLRPGEMLDGLGMAETTPGPLIMVLQFVGFMGAFRSPGPLPPMLGGTLGALLTTWVTFVPCFLWIFLGAPYIEALQGRRSLTSALSAITAAVVGVILNLAVWFALHTLFGTVNEVHALGMRLQVPVWRSLDPASLAIAVLAMAAMFRFKLGMIPTLAGSAGLGLVYSFVFGH